MSESSLFWPVPLLHTPWHFLADSHPVASWAEGTGKVWGGSGSTASPAILGASVPGPGWLRRLHVQRPLPSPYPPVGLPTYSLGCLVGHSWDEKACIPLPHPEALVWGLHPITQLEGPLEEAGLGLGWAA